MVKVAFANIGRGFYGKIDEIRHLLWSNSIDILGLAEPGLGPDATIPIIQGYAAYTNNQYRLIVYAKETLNLTFHQMETQTPSVLLKGLDTSFSFVYSEFRTGLEDGKLKPLMHTLVRYERLCNTMQQLSTHGYKKNVIMGDFNYCTIADRLGKDLTVQMEIMGFKQQITGPTRNIDGQWENQRASLLDQIWTRSVEGNFKSNKLPFKSDHSIIYFSSEPKTDEPKKLKKTIPTWKFCKESLHLARTVPTGITENDDMETMVEKLNDWMQTVDEPNHGFTTVYEGGEPWHDAKCSKFLGKLARASPTRRKEMRGLYVKVCKAAKLKYKKKIRERRGHPWPKKLRTPVKSLLRKSDGVEINAEEEVANELMDHFRRKVETNQKPEADFEDIFNKLKAKYNDLDLWDIPFATENDVKELIDGLPGKRSSGKCGFSYLFIKNIKFEILQPLTMLINQSIKEKKISSNWSDVIFIPVHKKQSKKNAANYRPIGMQRILARLTERYICQQFIKSLERRKIFGDHIHGFRANHSCETGVNHFIGLAKESVKKKRLTSALALDCSAAFDLLSPKVIIMVLEAIRCSEDTITWFKSYLANRTMQVKVGSKYSYAWRPEVGTIQGSCLSAILFCLVTVGMSEVITEKLTIYADDSIVVISGNNAQEMEQKFRRTVEEVSYFFDSAGLTVQPSKTEIMHFNWEGPTIEVMGERITPKKSIKFLGVIVQRNFKWQEHVDKIGRQIKATVWKLKEHANGCSTKEKLSMYYGYSQSLLNNGIGSYLPYLTKKQIKQLQVSLNHVLRYVMGLTRVYNISMTECRAAWKVPSVDMLREETMERLALEEKDVVMEEVITKIEQENTRTLRHKTIRIGWNGTDLKSMISVKIREKPHLTIITQRTTLKYVQRMYREVSFMIDLGVPSDLALKTMSERITMFLLRDVEREVECRNFIQVPNEELAEFEEKLRQYHDRWKISQ